MNLAFIILFEFDFTFVHINYRYLTYSNLKNSESIITQVYFKTD